MDTKAILREFLSAELINGQLSGGLGDDDELLLSGLVDSLGVVRLIAFIEERLHVQIPPEDVIIDHFQTVRAIADYLELKRS